MPRKCIPLFSRIAGIHVRFTTWFNPGFGRILSDRIESKSFSIFAKGHSFKVAFFVFGFDSVNARLQFGVFYSWRCLTNRIRGITSGEAFKDFSCTCGLQFLVRPILQATLQRPARHLDLLAQSLPIQDFLETLLFGFPIARRIVIFPYRFESRTNSEPTAKRPPRQAAALPK